MTEDQHTSSLIAQNFAAAAEKVNDRDFSSSSSSSSDSDDDDVTKKDAKKKPSPSKVNDDAPVNLPNVFRLFGRQQPLHKVLGAGKPADVFLWRDKKISAGVLGGATALWFLFEVMEYHLLTLVCHLSILTLAVLFLWSNASAYLNRSAPCITEIMLPEKCVLEVVSTLRTEIDQGVSFLHDIASGKDLKKFIAVIAGLWVVSIVGSWFNFLTLVYIAFVLLHTVPVLYEKYEDQVDSLGEKAWIEIKKQYAVFDEKVLSQIPIGPMKGKKKD